MKIRLFDGYGKEWLQTLLLVLKPLKHIQKTVTLPVKIQWLQITFFRHSKPLKTLTTYTFQGVTIFYK